MYFIVCNIIIVEVVAINYDWILTVVSVMAVGRIDKLGKIEIRRLMQALSVLNSEVSYQDIVNVSKILNCFEGTS